VLHLGGGDWITVDSCRDQSSGKNATLAYFEEIGVDVKNAVRLVVATHAHDDHVAGISEIHASAENAQFVLPRALTSEEFFAEVSADEDIEKQLRQSVRGEYRKIFKTVHTRGKLLDGRRPLVRADEQKLLWERTATESLPAARVVALSPSPEATERALRVLAQGAARVDTRRRLSAGDPNEYAIAIWVEVGDVSLLLGADLIIGPADCGWRAVVDSHNPAGKASIFKVPHHGSPNADHPPAWDKFLEVDVVSILAPFRGGSNPRPSESDIKRIVSRSGAAYSTARSSIPLPSRDVKLSGVTGVSLCRFCRDGG